MATNTLLELKTRFMRNVGQYFPLTATGGSTTSFVDSSLTDLASDEFPFPVEGKYLRVTSGAASGDLRRIVKVDKATGTLYVTRAFSSTGPASTHTGEVWGNAIYPGQSLTDLFNDALKVAKPITETKLTIVENQRFYDVTSVIERPEDIRRVVIRHIDTNNYEEPYNPQIMPWFGVAWHLTSLQTVAISGTPTGGTYTLTYGGTATSALAYNAAAATVQTALRLIDGLESVTVSGTGTTPNFTHTVTFIGVTGTARTLTATSSLTGGSSPAVAVATGTGVPALWLELQWALAENTTELEEIIVQHVDRLTAFSDDTSTVQSEYSDWLAWEAVLRHAVDQTAGKADRGNWQALAEQAKRYVMDYRGVFMPHVPNYVRHERPWSS